MTLIYYLMKTKQKVCKTFSIPMPFIAVFPIIYYD